MVLVWESRFSKYIFRFCEEYAVKARPLEFGDAKTSKVKANVAYKLDTASSVTVKSIIRRSKEQTETK